MSKNSKFEDAMWNVVCIAIAVVLVVFALNQLIEMVGHLRALFQ